MIEPLRYNKESAFAYEINRPAQCNSCLSQKQTRNNPNIAVKFCAECPAALGHQKDFGAFFCKGCDESIHDKVSMRSHIRQILVVGPGVRKRVLMRGDANNFPLPLDKVHIRVKSRIYHGGKRIHKEPAKHLTFISGSSGKTLHVQVLGARNLVAGDIGGMSDPFIVYSFCGKTLGSTRVRPRSLNPRWDNETFILPMDDNLPSARNVAASQRDMFKLEVYDYDWFSQNEFLGHLEISKSKLMKMAVVADQQPIRLPLSTKEFHGTANIRVGHSRTHFHMQVQRAESLDKQDAILLSNPYAKVFLGFDTMLLGTTSVIYGTINPEWGDGGANEFKVRIEQILLRERHILSNIAINREAEALDRSGDAVFDEFAEHLNILRIEIYNFKRFGKHVLLGKCHVSLDDLREMLPSLPQGSAFDLDAFAAEQQRNSKIAGKVSSSLSMTLSGLAGGLRRQDDDLDPLPPADIEQGAPPRPAMRPVPNPAALSRGKSVKALMPRFLSRAVLDEVTWSASHPVNVLKDSAKAMVAQSAAAMGATNGSLILRLIPSNRGSVIVGLDDAVRQMTLGEKANVKCRYDYAYNNYCMSSNIPPRANIIFTVELLEINGNGRFGMPWRAVKRFLRLLVRLFNSLMARLFPHSHSAPKRSAHHMRSSKSRRPASLSQRVQVFFGLSAKADRGADQDSDASSEGSDGDSDSLGDFDNLPDRDADLDRDEHVEEASARHGGRVKVDPRLRKHMNQSVRSGAQLMWGYVPPKAVPKTRKKIEAGKMSRESSRRLSVGGEANEEGDQEPEGEEKGGEEDQEEDGGSEEGGSNSDGEVDSDVD